MKTIQRQRTKTYWKAIIKVQFQGTVFSCESEKVFNTKEEVEMFIKKLMGHKVAKPLSIKIKGVTLPKPTPMNTVDMLSYASNRLGYDVNTTKVLAQKLYSSGLISYPRTECRNHAENFEVDKRLEMFERHKRYEENAGILRRRPNVGKTVKDGEQDHPPITPMHLPSYHKRLKDKSRESNLYTLIVDCFFASLSEDAKLDEIDANFEFDKNKFVAKYSQEVQEGFLKFLPLDKQTSGMHNITHNHLIKGKSYKITGFAVQQRRPVTKQYLSEAELVQKMEEKGIGTNGTIPLHIKKIIDRGYVEKIKDGNIIRLKPTARGIALAEGFELIDPQLFTPEVRQYIEKACSKISKYELKYETVIEEVNRIFRKKLDVFVKDFDKLQQRLEAYKEEIMNQKLPKREKRGFFGSDSEESEEQEEPPINMPRIRDEYILSEADMSTQADTDDNNDY